MATPLLMLGPGGDYQSRYYVKGVSLAKHVGQPLGQQPDTETAGGFAGYSRQQPGRQVIGYSEPQAPAAIDAFTHTEPLASPAYAPATARARAQAAAAPVASASLAPASLAAAAEAWLAAQQRTLIAIPLFSTEPTPAAAKPRTPHTRPLTKVEAPQPIAYRPSATPWPRQASAASPALSGVSQWLAPSLVTESSLHIDHASLTTASETFDEPHAQAAAHPHPHPRPAPGAGLLAHHAGAGRRAEREQGHHLRARRSAHQKRSALARPQQGSLFNG